MLLSWQKHGVSTLFVSQRHERSKYDCFQHLWLVLPWQQHTIKSNRWLPWLLRECFHQYSDPNRLSFFPLSLSRHKYKAQTANAASRWRTWDNDDAHVPKRKRFQSLQKHKPHRKAPTYFLHVFLNFSGRRTFFKQVLHLTKVARVREMGSSPRRLPGLWLKNLKCIQDNFAMLQTKCPFRSRGRTLSACDSSSYVEFAHPQQGDTKDEARRSG